MQAISYPQPGPATPIHLGAVMNGLRRRKRLLLTAILLVNATAIAITLLIPPRYTATATVAVEARDARVLATEPVARGLPTILPGDSSVMSTQVNMLRARALASEVVTALGLDQEPPPPSLLERLAGFARGRLPQGWHPPAWLAQGWLARGWHAALAAAAGPARPEAQHERRVDRFLERLSVGQQGDSRIVAVSVTASSPELAARAANLVVARYLARQLDIKRETTARAAAWAEARVATLEGQVVAAERAIADYMAANGLSRGPDGGLEQQQLTALQGGLAQARVDQASRAVQLAQLRQLGARQGGYETLPDVEHSLLMAGLQQQAAALQTQEAQLASRLGPQHPSVLAVAAQRAAITRKIGEQVGTIAKAVENDAALAGKRELALEQALDRGKAQYATAERASVQLRELTRTAAARRTVYEALLARSSEIREQGALLEPDARIVSPATPPVEPSFPNTGLFLVAGFVGSLGIGTALAALREHLDGGLRTARQIELLLGVPNLGLVPKVRRGVRGRRLQGVVFDKPRSGYAEAVRAIGATMRALTSGSRQILLVTSALPGEGKTTLAMSLGAVAARAGSRVVVVDLDLRHPSVARDLGLPLDAGVVEYVAAERALDQVLFPHPNEERLHVLPTGRAAESPGDVLASRELRVLIGDLYLRYDLVVLDLPPTLGLGDVLAVAPLADSVLLVVEWGVTSAAAAANAVEALARVGVTVTGTALTRVDLRRHSLYSSEEPSGYHRNERRYLLN